MKAAIWFVVGLIEALVFTIAVGLLSVQVSGALSGAVYDLNNTVVAVANPSMPLLQYVAIAVLSLLVLYTVTFGNAALSRSARLGLTAGVGVGLLTLTVWSFVLRTALIGGTAREQGIPTGWDGWVLLGGSSSVVHLLVLVATIAFVLALRRRSDVTPSPSLNTALQKEEAVPDVGR